MTPIKDWRADCAYAAGTWVVLDGAMYQAQRRTLAGESPETAPYAWKQMARPPRDDSMLGSMKTERL